MKKNLFRLASAYLILYLVIIVVKIFLSGFLVLLNPINWYAILAPLIYASAVLLDITGRVTFDKKQLTFLHIIIIPSIIFSFLGFGFLLFILTLMWWQVRKYGK